MYKKLNDNEGYSKCFLIILSISIATVLISNIASIKIISIGKIVLPSSALLFPITYILGDVIAEVYGLKKAKLIIVMGFCCNALMVLYFQFAIVLPSVSTWQLQDSFQAILSTTPRMFIASLGAYLVGSLSNAYVMQLIKKKTNGKYLWIRTIGSTIVGELFDTLIFASVAFWGVITVSDLITMIICQFCWKVSYEIISTPITYVVINKIKKLESVTF